MTSQIHSLQSEVLTSDKMSRVFMLNITNYFASAYLKVLTDCSKSKPSGTHDVTEICQNLDAVLLNK